MTSHPQRVTHFTADWFTQYASDWLRLLGDLSSHPVRALEIGSYEGRSACWMLDNVLLHEKSRLTCVDTWDGKDVSLGDKTQAAEAMFDSNTRSYGSKVFKVKDASLNVLSRYVLLDRKFDLVFIDGDHEGYSAATDLILSWELVSPGGWMVFDDYLWEGRGLRSQPKDAWDLWANLSPPRLGRIDPVGRMMFAQKRLDREQQE